ncbi:MAG: hypothetical protein ABI831_15060 [Betaproteobacteria bacterium]
MEFERVTIAGLREPTDVYVEMLDGPAPRVIDLIGALIEARNRNGLPPFKAV